MPLELRTKRTVFVRKVQKKVGEHTAEEIENQNPYLKVDEIVKIKQYYHVFKVQFKETAMADKVLEGGVSPFLHVNCPHTR